MSNAMYRGSALVFTHNLKNLAKLLKTAAADARARGYDPSVLLNARLAPDMFPFIRQVQVATDNAKGCCARLTGVKIPVFADNESTFPELQEEVMMQTPIGSIAFNGADYLNGWALPNFYFHYAAAYNLLRHNGVQLGKLDFLGPVPGMTMSGKIAKMMSGKTTAKAKKKR